MAQSESPAASVIIREEVRSIDKIVALKFPFSVATVTVDKPFPGAPIKTGVVGVGTTVGEGLGVGITASAVGWGESSTASAVGCGESKGDGVGKERILKNARIKAMMNAIIADMDDTIVAWIFINC